jgi:hypothetical protein
MSSKSDLSSHSAKNLKIRCLSRLNPDSRHYGWLLFALNTYVKFDADDDDSGLFDCFEIEALRLQLIESWRS